jgi:peptide/nickel transport system permease protein
MLVELLLGITIGAMAGYFGGTIDSILMRLTEAVLVIPQIFLLLVMAKYFAQSIPNINVLGRTFSGSVLVIIFVIGITSWPYLARIVRSQFLSENDFILAARATAPQHVTSFSPYPATSLPSSLLHSAWLQQSPEAYISFLGLGAPSHRHVG